MVAKSTALHHGATVRHDAKPSHSHFFYRAPYTDHRALVLDRQQNIINRHRHRVGTQCHRNHCRAVFGRRLVNGDNTGAGRRKLTEQSLQCAGFIQQHRFDRDNGLCVLKIKNTVFVLIERTAERSTILAAAETFLPRRLPIILWRAAPLQTLLAKLPDRRSDISSPLPVRLSKTFVYSSGTITLLGDWGKPFFTFSLLHKTNCLIQSVKDILTEQIVVNSKTKPPKAVL